MKAWLKGGLIAEVVNFIIWLILFLLLKQYVASHPPSDMALFGYFADYVLIIFWFIIFIGISFLAGVGIVAIIDKNYQTSRKGAIIGLIAGIFVLVVFLLNRRMILTYLGLRYHSIFTADFPLSIIRYFIYLVLILLCLFIGWVIGKLKK